MNTSKNIIKYLPYIALIFAMVVWSSSFISLKIALQSYPQMSIIFYRMLLATLLLMLIFNKSLLKMPKKSDIKYILLTGLFEPGLYFLFEINALTYTSAGSAGMIIALMPILTAFGAGFFLGEIISKKLILGSLLAVVGAILLSFISISNEYSPNPALGNFLEFLAAFCGAGYSIVFKKLSKNYTTSYLTFTQALFGTIFYLPLFLYDIYMYGLFFEKVGFLNIVYLGSVVALGGYGGYNYALSKIDASKVAVFLNLIPIFTIIISFIILDEMLTMTQVYLFFIILIGVIISQDKINIFKKPQNKNLAQNDSKNL